MVKNNSSMVKNHSFLAHARVSFYNMAMARLQLDDIHCDFSAIDGLERPFNCVIAGRHDGKTTTFLMKKSWPNFRKGKMTMLLFRQVNTVNEYTIRYYESLMQPFLDVPLNLKLAKGENGVAVAMHGKKPLFACVPLAMKTQSLKQTLFENCPLMVFDEYEIDPRKGEKYLPHEYDAFETLFGTMSKLNPDLRFYALTNPYSAYNPLFMRWGVNTRALKVDSMQKGKEWAVWFKSLNPKLVEKLKAKDPLFDEKSEYGRWAYGGSFANDRNNHVDIMRGGYRLSQRFVFDGQRFAAYEVTDFLNESLPSFYFKKDKDRGERRSAYAFEFADMASNTLLYTRDDRNLLTRMKRAMKVQDYACDSIETENVFQAIYDVI